jgi:hypothetical protein
LQICFESVFLVEALAFQSFQEKRDLAFEVGLLESFPLGLLGELFGR